MIKEKKNLSESILQRLKNQAKATHRRTDELLRYYAMERFLYRLSISKHCSNFFLKGGLMLKAWAISDHRPTLDIDLLGKTNNDFNNLKTIIKDICLQEAINDGITYETSTIDLSEIQVDGEYQGVRILFKAKLDSAKIPMQLDIGFSDVIFPEPAFITYPVILEFPSPHLQGYTPESVIAEKFEAMMKLGLINTRMKDFYDIWILQKTLSFNGNSLHNAIQATFSRRQTALIILPDSISNVFHDDPIHQNRWKQFLKKIEQEKEVVELSEVISDIKEFLQPIVEASANSQAFRQMLSYSKKCV